jgi:hypothetical protein
MEKLRYGRGVRELPVEVKEEKQHEMIGMLNNLVPALFSFFYVMFSPEVKVLYSVPPYEAVLWIRIRNNPNVLAGSESESDQKVRIRIRIRIQTLL